MPAAPCSGSSLGDLYSKCVQMVNENKISTKNAWELPLIDHMDDIVDSFMGGRKTKRRADGEGGGGSGSAGGRRSSAGGSAATAGAEEENRFHEASCTIEASARIYACRVDCVHTDTYRVLGGLSSADVDEEGKDGEDGKGPNKRRRICGVNTLEKNEASIIQTALDCDEQSDPSFRRMAAAFDAGGAKGLLLSHLPIAEDLSLVFNGDVPLNKSQGDLGSMFDDPTSVPCSKLGLGGPAAASSKFARARACPGVDQFRQQLWGAKTSGKVALPDALEALLGPDGAAAAHAPGARQLERFGMMIDAGSEGSRLVVFKWTTVERMRSDATVVTPVAIGNTSIVPGIGSFALHPEDAGRSLKPLIEYAKDQLRHMSHKWHKMPIWLRATAGMRLLHADERERVLDSVRQYLAGVGFSFKDDNAMVITGEEEGIYGWVAVNSKTGALNLDKPTHANTLGALDLGGASAQIVFMPEKSIMSHAFPLNIGKHRLRVYSYSFLHFGQREAAHRSADLIISVALEQVQSVDKLSHPCYSIGYTYQPRFAYSDNRTFPMEVAMQGSSDFDGCVALLTKIFKKSAPCLVESCSFYGVYQPHVYDNAFLAFSHFADVADALALPKNARLLDLKVATEYVCSLDLKQLDVIFARVKSPYDRLHLCFHSAYVYMLLTHGFGFDPARRQIAFKGRFDNGEPIDYIVGAMIYELNQDPWLVEARAADPSPRPSTILRA